MVIKISLHTNWDSIGSCPHPYKQNFMWRLGRSPPEPYPPHEEEYFQYYQINGRLFHLHRRIYTPLLKVDNANFLYISFT